MKLYNLEQSIDCYKVRLLLNILGIYHEVVNVNVLEEEYRQEYLSQMNHKRKIPLLEDGQDTIQNAQAILVYLASHTELYSNGPLAQARVIYWLITAAHEIHIGLATARKIKLFNIPMDYTTAERCSYAFLDLLEQHIEGKNWLELGHFTIADIAIFPHVALAAEGEISLENYPNTCAWIERVKSVPGYIEPPKVSKSVDVLLRS